MKRIGKSRKVFVGLAVVAVAICTAFFFLHSHSAPHPLSADNWPSASEYLQSQPITSTESTDKSQYLTMRDGVRIAVTTILPANLRSGQRLPTLLRSARYWRRWNIPWPASAVMRDSSDPGNVALQHGYAMVNMDIRGSGASFGTRSVPFSDSEARDGDEVVNWIAKQPWSNGAVGVWGLSFESVSALLLLAEHNAAIKACFFDRGGFDVYQDFTHPGGVPSVAPSALAKMMSFYDEGELPPQMRPPFYFRMFMHGVTPVDGTEGKRLLAQAVAEHRRNGDIGQLASEVVFRDDDTSLGIPTQAIGASSKAEQISASGTPLLILHGWMDGAGAGLRAFNTLTNPRRVIIGPWNHGLQDASPFTQWHAGSFNLAGEVLQFFDHYLKGERNGYEGRAPVQYFTMGAERWNFAKSWPPPAAQSRRLYFEDGGRLSRQSPASAEAFDTYTADRTFRSVPNPSLLLREMNFTYADRRATDAKSLHYTSEPLTSKLLIAGSVRLDLWVDSSATDDEFIAWLEDQDEHGIAQYVTSGCLRGIQRRPAASASADARLVTHTFLRADAMPLNPGQAAEIAFELAPTSYELKAGHRIRLVLAGSDVGTFIPLSGAASVWKVHRDIIRASSINIPIERD